MTLRWAGAGHSEAGVVGAGVRLPEPRDRWLGSREESAEREPSPPACRKHGVIARAANDPSVFTIMEKAPPY